MRAIATALILGLFCAPAAALARPAIAAPEALGGGSETTNYLQCVPFARTLSGIHLYGDALTWWNQAEGRYARGHVPKVGAVMALRPHNNSVLGHVATVSRVIDTRTILISHANWSNPGQIERNVTAVDVSPANDWSEVRVWYGPVQNLGASRWPVAGFIYNAKPGQEPRAAKLARDARPRTLVLRTLAPRKVDRRKDPIGAIIAGSY